MKLRKLLCSFFAFILIFSCFFSSENVLNIAAASAYDKLVTPKTTTYLYIYKSNSTKSDKIGCFYQGDGATILKKGSTWWKIKSGSITGYVKKSNLLTGKKLESYAKQNNFPKELTVNVRSLIVRKSASKKSAVLTGVSKGEKYTVLAENNGWSKIKADGVTGYVSKDYTTTAYKLGTAKKYVAPKKEETAEKGTYSDIAVCNVKEGSRLNIREKENTSSAIVGYMTQGAGAKIVKKGKEWTKIQSGTIIGYIKNDYYVTGSDVESYAKKIGLKKTATLNANMNIRKKASVTSARIGGASKGSTFEIKKETASWVSITFNGKTGYLKKSYLTIDYNFKTPTAASSSSSNSTSSNVSEDKYEGGVSGSEIVAYAKKFLGNPYVYGGTSLTKGCDCSGFTQSVFKHFGINIPRTSYAQSNSGKSVSLSNLKAGDLLFYAKNGTVNHVGIYMGNGRVINASNEKVGITTYTHTYRTIVAIRRYY